MGIFFKQRMEEQMTPSEKQSRDFLDYLMKEIAEENKRDMENFEPIHQERPLIENAEDYFRSKPQRREREERERQEEFEKNPKFAGSSFLMDIVFGK